MRGEVCAKIKFHTVIVIQSSRKMTCFKMENCRDIKSCYALPTVYTVHTVNTG